MPRIDLQRANQWAGVGSFFVAVIGLGLLTFQIWGPQRQVADTATSQPVQAEAATTVVRVKPMEWLPIGLIVFGVLAGGAMHLMAARTLSGAARTSPNEQVPRIEVTTSGYPMQVDPAASTTLIAWKNKYVPEEGGRVEFVKGSIHVALWNKHGLNRTAKLRLLRFK